MNDIDFDPLYMSRSWDGDAMLKASQDSSKDDVVQLLKELTRRCL